MKRWEIFIYALLVVALNASLITGSVCEPMIFSPQPVLDGQIWRIITHPFVHVSWYHLLLDAVAFFVLYMQLAEPSRTKRTFYVIGCGISSLLTALIALPAATSTGYCGLSGIGHGLMAVSALEMIANKSPEKSTKRSGFICLAMLIAKCIFEAVTGKMFLSFLHPDLLGTPIALAHSGGVLGACLMYIIFNRLSPAPSPLRQCALSKYRTLNYKGAQL